MQMAEIGGVSLRSQQQYEKGNVAPTTDYLTRLYEAGFDVVYLITGKRSTEALTAEDSELLRVWYQAEPLLRKIAWRVLTTNGDQGGDPEAYFKTHRDKTNKTNTFRLLLGGAALYLLPIIFSATGVELFGKQKVANMQAFSVYLYTIIGILLVSVIMIGYAVGVHIRNSWLLMPVYKWCRYNLFDQLWRKWQGDPDGEGKKALAKIRLWHAFNDRETAKERYHENPTKRRKAKMEKLEARWQEKYRAFLSQYGFCAPVV